MSSRGRLERASDVQCVKYHVLEQSELQTGVAYNLHPTPEGIGPLSEDLDILDHITGTKNKYMNACTQKECTGVIFHLGVDI